MKVQIMEHSEDDFTNYITSETKHGSKTVCANCMQKAGCCLGPGYSPGTPLWQYGQAALIAGSNHCSPS